MKKCIFNIVGYIVCIIISVIITYTILTKYVNNKLSNILEEKQYIQVSTKSLDEYRKDRYLKLLEEKIKTVFLNQNKISKETMCLAKNIYYEARGESFEDKIYVANVTINRTESDDYPPTICGTVFEPYQFSWTIKYKQAKKVDTEAWNESLKIASWVVNNRDRILDFTNGAIFYHANYVNPNWAKHKKQTLKTEAHIFYK